MKKLIPLLSLLLMCNIGLSQSWQGTGNPPCPGPQCVGTTTNFIGTDVANNIPIRIGTFGNQRLYIDNTAGGVLGNVGIGSLFGTFFRPVSMLHIAQDNGIFSFGSTRPWMSPGLVNTVLGGTGMLISNGDNVWLGLRNKGAFDLNDAILNWGDNGGNAGQGADFFRFVFTNYNLGVEPGGINDGLEIMRFSPLSFVGIGDFQVNNKFDPQSKLHIHEDIFLQPTTT
jgi:hypothetical protein